MVVDYGLGNIRSVIGALKKLGYRAKISKKREDLVRADRIILPGVGAFGDGMLNLQADDLISILEKRVLKEGCPFLGICLGFQLMFVSSDEFGLTDGLGWIEGEVKRFDESQKQFLIPHVGWNDVRQVSESTLLRGIDDDALFYFVHSYRVRKAELGSARALCFHGEDFVSIVEKDNIFGTQFHPEKSQKNGLQLLRNFVELT